MYLVDIEFLKENPVVIDCRFDMQNPSYGPKAYEKNHYPGAYYMDLEKDMTSKIEAHGGRHPLPDLNEFALKIGSFGVIDTSKILIYDDGDLPMACRLWVMLKLLGLKEVYILKDGYQAFLKAEIQLSNERPKPVISELKFDLDMSYICSMEETKEALSKENAIVIDSRAPERYAGLTEPFDKIAGHMPGAVNYFWKDLFDEKGVKSYGNIEAHFLEMHNYDQVIVHCGSGITGAVNQFFLREMNIPAVLYLGSYSDWLSYDDNEIIIKDNQRIKVHP
ncbi:MAG: sulfurtransferase [Clostridia bacterium]|nr:sulfurtransferase [Clostridia bacterium]